jgi:hypothetical protein
MKKRVLFSILILFFTFNFVFADGLNITGYVRNYDGILLNDNMDFSIVQNTLDLNFTMQTSKMGFKVNPYVYQYSDKTINFDIRELYLDLFFNSFDIRIGKQQIIWGKADGVFITDIISPKDLSEFLLRDFEEIRMGITAVKLDYYIGDNTFELVWVPVFSATKFPSQDSIWAITPAFPVQPKFDFSQKEIKPSIKNSEIFAKYSIFSSAVDFEIMGGYTWDADPVIHTLKEIDPLTHQLLSLTAIPEHHRLTVAGGSFSTTLGPVVIRGEGAYYWGKHFQSNDPAIKDGVIEKNYINYLLGADFSISGIKFSTQFIQQIIPDYNDFIVNNKSNNLMTILARKDFLDGDTLHLEFFSYLGLTDGDGLIRPKISYDISDGVNIMLGANIFFGDKGMFGRFNKNDMVYMKIKYSF